jgi:UDP-N-acetylmuramoyl-L-alanyl-D-glutamate--2,6-diaminopimelate ligase
MGRIASREADIAIFTSDNPRTEDPEKILDQVVAGAEAGRQTLRISDRAQAIRTAVMLAKAGDIILIAGKGHEDYQIIGTEKIHFDDREQVGAAFKELGK